MVGRYHVVSFAHSPMPVTTAHDPLLLLPLHSGAGAETVSSFQSPQRQIKLIIYPQTAAALSVFILAMRLYPNVMKRAQAEIDDVVGRDRLPTFADRENLPYIRAIVKEVLRWRPVGPLGLPRRTSQDDVYEGYFIPKGSLVIANAW